MKVKHLDLDKVTLFKIKDKDQLLKVRDIDLLKELYGEEKAKYFQPLYNRHLNNSAIGKVFNAKDPDVVRIKDEGLDGFVVKAKLNDGKDIHLFIQEWCIDDLSDSISEKI